MSISVSLCFVKCICSCISVNGYQNVTFLSAHLANILSRNVFSCMLLYDWHVCFYNLYKTGQQSLQNRAAFWKILNHSWITEQERLLQDGQLFSYKTGQGLLQNGGGGIKKQVKGCYKTGLVLQKGQFLHHGPLQMWSFVWQNPKTTWTILQYDFLRLFWSFPDVCWKNRNSILN